MFSFREYCKNANKQVNAKNKLDEAYSNAESIDSKIDASLSIKPGMVVPYYYGNPITPKEDDVVPEWTGGRLHVTIDIDVNAKIGKEQIKTSFSIDFTADPESKYNLYEYSMEDDATAESIVRIFGVSVFAELFIKAVREKFDEKVKDETDTYNTELDWGQLLDNSREFLESELEEHI